MSTADHRIALLAQKIGELLQASKKAYGGPNHALEDICYLWEEFKASDDDRQAVFSFMYQEGNHDPREVTMAELQFMIAICKVGTMVLKAERPPLVNNN